MKTLASLNAKFAGAGGEGITNSLTGEPVPRREGIGVLMDCPCGCERKLYVPFKNPLDGGPERNDNPQGWDRTGDTIETLTLKPSVLRSDPGGCKWHGFITNGNAETC